MKPNWYRSWMAICLTGFVLIQGCASQTEVSTDVASLADVPVMEYRIGPADVLSISVWDNPDLNRTVTVRPDGRISFPLVGEIYVTGLTPRELQNEMETALNEFVNVLPGEVAIVVDEVHSYTVSVLGEVNLPGRFEFQHQVTVLDALAEAGGLTEFASGSEILILRPNDGNMDRLNFNFRDVVQSRNNDRQVLVYPGDVIVVP